MNKPPEVKLFDPNEDLPGGGHSSLTLPSLPMDTIDDGPAQAHSAGEYVRIFEQQYREMPVSGYDHTPLSMQGVGKSTAVAFAKAGGSTLPPSAAPYGRFAYMPDPQSNGVIEWPGIQPEALRKIVKENVAPQLIIGMRCSDVLRYSERSMYNWMPGWTITIMDGSRAPNKAEMADIREAELFLENSGIEMGYDEANKRDSQRLMSFPNFLDAATRDSLTYAAIALWKDVDSQGRVKAYSLLPAGHIRFTGSVAQDGRFVMGGYQGDPDIFAVLVSDTKEVLAQFTRDELTYFVRNPRTDVDVFGYGYPELEIAIRLIQGYQNALDLNCDTFVRCYSEDTEVLTKDGWKFFGDVDIELDTFATLNMQSGALEYQQASAKTWQAYEGDMYALKSRSLDFIVTPNHRIITQYRPEHVQKGHAEYVVTEAAVLHTAFEGMAKMSRQNYGLPAVSKWAGVEVRSKSFAMRPKHYGADKDTTRTISGDDYCAFMGMFLSEGNLARDNTPDRNTIVVHQFEKSKGFIPFKEVLTRVLGHEPRHYNDRFMFGWREFARHLELFGEGSYTWRIPQEILDATPRQQKIFWDFYSLGDGCRSVKRSANSNGPHIQEHIATTSRVMADNLQELAQKMGYAATICTIADPMKYKPCINGRVVKSCVTRYDVYLKQAKLQAMNMTKVSYSGMIGCVTVPNGTLYVRRKGKSIWSGNSAIPNGILVLSGGQVTQRQLDLLNRIWTNLKKGITKSWALPVMGLSEGTTLTVLDLSRMKGNEAYYKDFMNMLAGALSTVYRFPVNRFGYKISGQGRDTEPLPDSTTDQTDADDPGLAPLLKHLAAMVNQYLLWSRWPHLRFGFNGMSPKEDARRFESRKNSMTFKEARAENDLPPLEDIEKDEVRKFVAGLMDLAPIDPNLAGVYQSIVASVVKAKFDPGGKDAEQHGNAMESKKDPAKSEEHGHTSGVRRDSAAETSKNP